MPLVVVAALALGLVLVLAVARARRTPSPEASTDLTPAIDAWVAEALERELAETVLGLRASTPEERRKLTRSLRGDPDPDVVGKVEEAVRTVELEFVKYAHEPDAEVKVHVRYEDGRTASAERRLPWSDVPEAVRADFDRRSATRVFRTWPLPWARMRAL